jgi:beta-lactamase class D
MNKFTLSLLATVFLFLSSCTPNHAKIDSSLKKYFDSANVEGCFALLNNQMGNITVYNMGLDTLRLASGSSFKIPETLIGIQTGKITNGNTRLFGDSANTSNPTLKDAFTSSSVPFFSELEKQIGKDTLQFWIDSLGYGNKKLSENADSTWPPQKLEISPDEQLGLMSKLYFDQLPLQKYAQDMVTSLLTEESDSLYKLNYTTASGVDSANHPIGWALGWIEENRHIYFFITFARSTNPSANIEKTAADISKAALKHLGFFQGQK